MSAPALRIEGLAVDYGRDDRRARVLRDVDLTIPVGATHGLVGESGSGKSTLALAAIGALGRDAAVRAERIELAGVDLRTLDDRGRRDAWRHRVALVPQDAGASLNPRVRVGAQVAEALDGRDRRRRVRELLARVGLHDPDRVAAAFPHQLSGGMQQRAMIAMALGGAPDLLILDEPTTHLDVTTQATILDLVGDLVRERGTAVLHVSHDLGTIASLCERASVLYAGEVVEEAPVVDLFARPLHPYARALLEGTPRLAPEARRERLRPIEGRVPPPGRRPPGCVFAPRCPVATEFTREHRPDLEAAGEGRRVRCHRWREIADDRIDPRPPAGGPRAPRGDAGATVLEVRDLAKAYPLPRGAIDRLRGRPPRAVRALAGVDLALRRRRTLGLVGESGSGKSTLARIVAGLAVPTEGRLELLGAPLPPRLADRDRATLRRVQMVFQDADEALNPYLTVGETLMRPLRRFSDAPRDELERRRARLLERVRLDPDHVHRRPAQLSGGEKQRVAIARALAADPDLLILDESVSGLDVSVQAAILDLLDDLRRERESAFLFVSHDLAVVAHVADDVAVLHRGRLVEVGPTEAVLAPPHHPYTEALLAAAPTVEGGIRRERVRPPDAPAGADAGSGGCPLHGRCAYAIDGVCDVADPPWRELPSGKRVRCHLPPDDLPGGPAGADGAAGAFRDERRERDPA